MPVTYSKLSAGPSTRRARGFTPQAEVAGSDYGEMTKAELQDELERRDLPKTGNKDELIDRLKEDDAS